MSIAQNGIADKCNELAVMVEELDRFVNDSAAQGVSLRQVERGVFDSLLKMGRALMDQFLSLQGDGDLGETAVDDDGRTLYRSAEPARRELRTIFGEHRFAAYVYRQGPHPHTPIVFRPVDARMSLSPARWSHLLEELTQLLCVDEAFATAAETFERIFRQKLSVKTLERVNQRMGAEAGEFLDELPVPPVAEEGELLVLSGDGKGVPMVQDDARKLQCFEERALRPGNRRMATLAAVYSVDRYMRTPEEFLEILFRDPRRQDRSREARPQPCHKHVIARLPQVIEEADDTQPVRGSVIAMNWAARQVAQRRRPAQPLVCLMDGQASLWDDMADFVEPVEQPGQPERVEILDVVHVASYVWRAAKVFHAARERQEAFVRERLLRILHGEVKGVVSGLRRMATLHGLTGELRREIDTVCRYFTTHAERMRYDVYLAEGCPIASGVIEGACRHLVKDRMERSGMRWTQDGAQAMLDVRAVHQSSYWDAFHEQRATRSSASATACSKLIQQANPLAG